MIAGVINTVAGGGSFLTLPALMALGMPPGVANGTNRVAVAIQTLVGAFGFHRAKKVDYQWVKRLSPPLVLGASAGAYVASVLDASRFRSAFGVLLMLMGGVVLLKPRLLRRRPPQPTPTRLSPWVVGPVFLVIGFFGGFIQAGVGILLVSAMLLLLGLDVAVANAVKLVVVFLFTLPALVIFAVQGQLVVLPGLVLSLGNALGAWLGVRVALKVPLWVLLGGIALMAVITGLALLL